MQHTVHFIQQVHKCFHSFRHLSNHHIVHTVTTLILVVKVKFIVLAFWDRLFSNHVVKHQATKPL